MECPDCPNRTLRMPLSILKSLLTYEFAQKAFGMKLLMLGLHLGMLKFVQCFPTIHYALAVLALGRSYIIITLVQ